MGLTSCRYGVLTVAAAVAHELSEGLAVANGLRIARTVRRGRPSRWIELEAEVALSHGTELENLGDRAG